MSILKKLTFGLEKKFFVFTFIAPVCMVGEVVMETFIPYLMSFIIDKGVIPNRIDIVIRLGLIMVCAAVFSLVCGVLCGRFSAVASLGFSRNLRRNLFKKVQELSFSDIDLFGTGSLVTRLTTDVTNLQDMYQNIIRTMVRSPLMLVSGTVMACLINIKLACVFFVTIPLLTVIITAISVKAFPRFNYLLKKYDFLNMIVQENLIGIRIIKSFVRQDFECSKFDGVAEDLRKAQIAAEKLIILTMPVMQLSIYMCIIAVIWFGGNLVLNGSMTAGELISFISYVAQVLTSLMMLSGVFIKFIISWASVNRVVDVIDKKSSENLISNQSKQSSLKDGSIDFNHVSFSYTGLKDKNVLSDINLHIGSGDTVGIIGGTGSSKTTLISLIFRLYDAAEGEVSVGGVNVLDCNQTLLRNKIGVVLQDNILFTGTVSDNLRWGNEKALEKDLIEACQISCAHEFIQNLSDGYETYLGRGGVNLSGGQKQRLCIARAVIKKPLVLILDDALSSVDTITELSILNELEKKLPDTTKIIISQKIRSVRKADYIIVMDNGKIDGTGTHDELLVSNRIYREVYESQRNEMEGSL